MILSILKNREDQSREAFQERDAETEKPTVDFSIKYATATWKFSKWNLME